MVDAAKPLPELDLAAADEWRVLVLDDGEPCAYVVMASPGRAGKRTLEMALLRHAALRPPREPGPPPADIRVSLVVPTHRRPDKLRDLLATVAALDPAPAEVLVVDNDPGPDDVEALVAELGFRYVREDRRGLNIARRRGLVEATGDVVAFTDDDCLLPETWLRPLPRVFGDPAVAAVTGPGFAHELRTGAQLRRDEEAGFQKELVPRRYSMRNVSPVNAGRVGSGNGMAFRREQALELEVFTPELDAGTRAPAAGDLFALYRVLSHGHEVAYEPGFWFLHRHPAEPGSARAIIRNYGDGVGAYLAKVLVEERRADVLGIYRWFFRRWIEAVLDALTGEGDRGRVRVRWEFLWGVLTRGPVARRRALADLDHEGRAVLARSRAAAAPFAAARGEPLPAPRRPAATVPPREDGDARGACVVFGPGERVTELPAEVVSAQGSRDPVGWWEAVASAARSASGTVVAIPLPGVTVGPEWILDVADALEGDRVAVALGAGLLETEAPAPVELFGCDQMPAPYALRGAAAQYVAFRRDRYDELGGLRPELAGLAPYAPVLDLVERALDAGLVVAGCDARDIEPPGRHRPARTRGQWARSRARGAVMGAEARSRGLRWLLTCGVVPLVRLRRPSALRRSSVRNAAGSLAAFCLGAGAGLVAGRATSGGGEAESSARDGSSFRGNAQ